MKTHNIVFIGGQSNGKVVYEYLKQNRFVNLSLVITYPDMVELPRKAPFPDEPETIKDSSANKYMDKIRMQGPDFIFVAGWSELLQDELISCAKEGTIGFHPSKLPYDRGRSVLAWQIEDGYTETALSMFYYNSIPDCGDIIGQDKITIAQTDYIQDVLDKLDGATKNLMRVYYPLLRKGIAPRLAQDPNVGSFRRLRDEQDQWIHWDRPASDIINKIRAISRPYPGALGTVQDHKLKIWKAAVLSEFPISMSRIPGYGVLVAKLYDESLIVKCRDGFIQITEYEMV